MDKLPPELIDRISGLLNQTDLKATLLLSRKFQYGAERHSGVFSHAQLTADITTTQKFLSVYSGHRLQYLRRISFETSVPGVESEEQSEHDPEQLCRDTENELRMIDQEFTKQISILFTTMSSLESRVGAQYRPGRLHLTIYTPTRYLCIGECYHRKCTSWRVHLLSPFSLPEISSVRTLTFEVPFDDLHNPYEGTEFCRHIEYRVLLDIARRCPMLDTLKCKLGGREWLGSFKSQTMKENCQDWAGPRRDSRHSLWKAIQGIEEAVPFLRHARLDFLHPLRWAEDFDHHLTLPDLVKPALWDPFSSSLRVLSHQLRTMNLRVVADETLFWPGDIKTDGYTWPNMESVHVMFNNSHPCGSWYFSGEPRNSTGYMITADHYPPLEQTDRDRKNDCDDESEYFLWEVSDGFTRSHTRVFPQDSKLVPFLVAFARAAAYMPKLKEFILWTPIKLDVSEFEEEYPTLDSKSISRHVRPDHHLELAWGIAYTSPNANYHPPGATPHDTSIRNLWWRVGGWRPQASLRKLFQEIGQKEHTERVEEHWNDMENQDDGLDDRDWFEDWTYSVYGDDDDDP